MSIKKSDIDAIGFLSENHNVDLEISLEGMSIEDALETVDNAIIEGKNHDITKIWFKFDMGKNDGKRTLFQPVGQALKEKLHNQEVIRIMPSSQGGWIARFK